MGGGARVFELGAQIIYFTSDLQNFILLHSASSKIFTLVCVLRYIIISLSQELVVFTVLNLFTTIHDGNFRRHSSVNVTIK